MAVGKLALQSQTTGHSNTAMGPSYGDYAGADITTGTFNTMIGCDAGNTTTTGTNNTCLGNGALASSTTASNEFVLGNSGVSTLRCQQSSISSLSDERDKDNIVPLAAGLDFVNDLRPVAFDWEMRDGARRGVADTGFIAQELQKTQETTGIEIPGLVYDANPDRLEAAYGKLIPVLVAAVKELSAKVAELEARLGD